MATLKHKSQSVRPQFQSSASPFTSRGPGTLFSCPLFPIFLFRTRSVNKILCRLWPLWFLPSVVFFSPPSCLFLPGGTVCVLCLRWDFFPLQGKVASTFSLFFITSTVLRPSFYLAHRTRCLPKLSCSLSHRNGDGLVSIDFFTPCFHFHVTCKEFHWKENYSSKSLITFLLIKHSRFLLYIHRSSVSSAYWSCLY